MSGILARLDGYNGLHGWCSIVGDPVVTVDSRMGCNIQVPLSALSFVSASPLREWYERWEGADPDEVDILDLLVSLRPLLYPKEAGWTND